MTQSNTCHLNAHTERSHACFFNSKTLGGILNAEVKTQLCLVCGKHTSHAKALTEWKHGKWDFHFLQVEAQSKEKWLFSCSHMTANHHESERTRKITANWSNEYSNRKPEGLSIMMFGLHCSQRQHTKTTQSKIADESQVHQRGSHQYTTLTNCYAFQTTNEQVLRPSNEL